MADERQMANAVRRQSIARRLPLLVAALLFTVVGTLSVAAYREMERALGETSLRHTDQVAAQLVALLDSGTAGSRNRVALAAGLPEMQAVAATGEDPDTLMRRASRSGGRNVIGVGIRTTDPSWLMWADGPAAAEADRRPSDAVAGGRSATAAELAALVRQPQPVPAESASGVGPLRSAGATVYYDVSAPIPPPPDQPDRKAWLVVRYTVSGDDDGQTIASLVGDSAAFLTGSAVTNVWTDLARGAPAPVETGPGRFTWNGRDYYGALVSSPRKPWQTWVGLPRATVMAPAAGMTGRMAIIAVLILTLGTLGAFFLSRHIARPITELTTAVEGVTQGNYQAYVPVTRHDEIGRLADAFNAMAARVSAATHNLEGQVSSRTRELEHTLRELHDAQEQLVRREKLAMLGQLASGVGHELRNPLGVMTNSIYYLEMVQHDAPETVKEYHGILRAQLALAEKIVADLLDFSRLKTPDRQMTTLEFVAEQQIARLGLTEGVELVREYRDATSLMIDPVQVGQVVFNLLTNAVQATGDEGGVVTVRTGADPGSVWLEVEDRGVGIAESDLAKIFEPLYTTKARGIGLGLSVSRSLAENNDGQIEVRSRQGHGATFRLTFPAERNE